MKTPVYILDTSVLADYLAEDKSVKELKQYSKAALLPFVVLTEIYYLIFRRKGKIVADEILQSVLNWQLTILNPNEQICLSAGLIKGKYSLGIADSFIAAFALASEATLITKDPDFRILEPHLKLLYF